ncbi:MAG: TetR/AcrR family transcriptional regulator [Solirubrobacterales bacterium]
MTSDRIELTSEMLSTALGSRWNRADVDAAVKLLASGEGKFPAGVRTLPGELVKDVQRERILVATWNAVAELGYRDTTVQEILNRAGISRPTFYEQFGNKEDCFLAALDSGARRLGERVETAAAEGGDQWRDRLRMGLEELLRFVATEPDIARVLIVEARAAGRPALLRRDALLDAFANWIDTEVRDDLPESPSAIAAAGIVGGIEAVLYARISKGETDLLPLLPSLMYFAVLPYGGHAAAAEELSGIARS